MRAITRLTWIAGVVLATAVGTTAQASFTRYENGVRIAFDNGVKLTIKAPDGEVAGLTHAKVNGHWLRSPEFAAHPVFKLTDGTAYASCRLESVEQDGEAIVLACKLVPKGGEGADSLTWIFEPRNQTVRDRDYVGFAYRYEFESESRKLDEILDLATWEIGGDIVGKYVQPGRLATAAEAFRGYRRWTFVATPWFRFQCGSDGMLYDVYESVCPAISWEEKRVGSSLLRTFDIVQQELRNEGATPFRQVMFCDDEGTTGLECVDEYTKVFDHLEGQARAEFGIVDPDYMPMCKMPQTQDETFELRIEDLAEIADLGFKGIWMATLESVSTKLQKRKSTNAGVYSLDPAELLGGSASLRKLVDEAHRQGIKIYTWAPGGQLRIESEVLKANPDWMLHVAEGKRPRLGGSTDLHSGYYDYAIGKYRDLHAATGIDGIWFDSYNAAATGVQVRDDGTRYFQVRKAFQQVADTQKAGIRSIQLEVAGPSGQDSGTSGYFGIGTPGCYKSATYIGTCRTQDINYYYRWIANKAFPMLPVRYVNWTYEYKSLDQFPKLQEQVRQTNLDWAAVQDLMVERHLIAASDDAWKDVGVEWTKPGESARALFSYGEFDYPLPAGARVTDVTDGKAVETAGTLRTKCCHTYRIETGR